MRTLFALNWILVVVFVTVLAKPSLLDLPAINSLENSIDSSSGYNVFDEAESNEISTLTKPGLTYANTIENLEALGIDTQSLPKDVLEDATLTVPEIIKKYGYDIEVHTITTSDGYILEMHRLPGKPDWPHPKKKQPVFLMHGLLESSSCWVIMGPEKSLAYLLSDLGYDVWMGNARGSRYSRNHTKYDPDGKRSQRRRFWSFSWHEVGVVDLPEMIDYVLGETNYEKLHYIGHSQGTTSFWVMASELPEYNDKILSMHALAPVAFMSNLRSPFIRAAALFMNTLDAATSVLGMYELLPSADFINIGGGSACHEESPNQELCANILFLICGYNSEQLNRTTLPVIVGHMPAGASTNQLIHYGQGIRRGKFRQFDHGVVNNLIRYKQMRPPAYNLKNIRAPVVLHYSANDWLAEPIDVEELHRNLPNVIGKYLVSDPKFNHLDFVFAIDVKTLLYNRLFNVMRLVEQGELLR